MTWMVALLKLLSRIALVCFAFTGCIQTEKTTVTSETTNLTPVVEVLPPQNNNSESLPSNENTILSPPVVTTPTEENSESIMEDGFVILNISADQRTKDSFLDLQMITLDRNQMRVSFDPSCSSGVWEEYQEFKTYKIPQNFFNERVRISVQFKDFDNVIKECHVLSVRHDNRGPDIIFKKYPTTSVQLGTDIEIQAEVTDSVSTVKSVACSFNGVVQSCHAGVNDVKISSLPVNQYKFEMSAEDDLGNKSTASVAWSVVQNMKSVEQQVTVDDYKKVDILFVIDNSGSMEYEQKSMASRTSNFLSVLRGLDYNIAIATTDPTSKTWGDGRLLQLTGGAGRYFITSDMAEATAQTLLSQTLQRTETGSGSEQGIRTVYRLLERYNAGEDAPKRFFRPGAQFAVVIISDEDESDNTFRNDPATVLEYLARTFNSQKRFNFHSIITRPGDTACKNADGYSYGERLKAFSDLTGGLVGDVCASDYASQVQGAADGIRNLLKTLTLSCVPLADQGIVIKKDGVVVTSTYSIEGLNLKFDKELEPGSYIVNYKCIQ